MEWIAEERICKQCTLGEVEGEAHFVLRCEALSEERRNLLRHMELVDGWQDGEEGAKLALILEQACIDQGVGRDLERMWRSRGLKGAELPDLSPFRAAPSQPTLETSKLIGNLSHRQLTPLEEEVLALGFLLRTSLQQRKPQLTDWIRTQQTPLELTWLRY